MTLKAELNREQLGQFFDMKQIDNVVHHKTLEAMVEIGKDILPVLLEAVYSKSLEDLKPLQDEATAKKVFESLMAYSYNLMVSKIDQYSEEGIKHSVDVANIRKTLEGKGN